MGLFDIGNEILIFLADHNHCIYFGLTCIHLSLVGLYSIFINREGYQ